MFTNTFPASLRLRQSRRTLQMKVQCSAVATSQNDYFCIRDIQYHVHATSGDLLSYKQVRNALYRLRQRYGEFYHVARGSYRWL